MRSFFLSIGLLCGGLVSGACAPQRYIALMFPLEEPRASSHRFVMRPSSAEESSASEVLYDLIYKRCTGAESWTEPWIKLWRTASVPCFIALDTTATSDRQLVRELTKLREPACIKAPLENSSLWVIPQCYFGPSGLRWPYEARNVFAICSLKLVGVSPIGAPDQMILLMPTSAQSFRYQTCHDEFMASKHHMYFEAIY